MKTLKIQILLALTIAGTLFISAYTTTEPLKPQIKVNKKAGYLPLMVSFSCNEQSPQEIFFWELGNGTSTTGRFATTVYSRAGTYQVKVTARNGSEVAQDSISIEVLPNDDLVNNMAKQRLAQAE